MLERVFKAAMKKNTIILAIVLLGVAFMAGFLLYNGEPTESTEADVSEVIKNPSQYLNKSLKLSGKFVSYATTYMPGCNFYDTIDKDFKDYFKTKGVSVWGLGERDESLPVLLVLKDKEYDRVTPADRIGQLSLTGTLRVRDVEDYCREGITHSAYYLETKIEDNQDLEFSICGPWERGLCMAVVSPGYVYDKQTNSCNYIRGGSGCSSPYFQTEKECELFCKR